MKKVEKKELMSVVGGMLTMVIKADHNSRINIARSLKH